MVDFTKMLKENKIEKPLEPIKIFNSLDTIQGKEYLRDSQRSILTSWNLKLRSNRDVIVKLHTGHGKTLVGLLMIQSKINELKKPGLFLCPNNFLVDQIYNQAKEFGISVVKARPGEPLPIDFINCKAILITSVNKIFNGKSLFGVKNNPLREIIELGSVVIDDAHKSLAIIRNSFSVKIPKRKEYLPIYHSIIRLFQDDLEKQNAGLLFSILQGDHKIMQIPYWNWKAHVNDIRNILNSNKTLNEITFTWDLINTSLSECICLISGTGIEITPRILPLDMIPSFEKANQKIYLSATLTDDVFLIKDFGIDKNVVLNPLTYSETKYSGERPIIIPSLIDSEINRTQLVEWINNLAKNSNGDYGIFSIVPSKKSTYTWKQNNSEIILVQEIQDRISQLKKKIKKEEQKKPIVLVNQYDGIDLPDNLCRILVLDQIPEYQTLYDEFLHMILPNSFLKLKNIAQRIEQGIGRGIRGKNDYCLVLILGGTLSRFFLEGKKQKFLSNEVKKQIQIGEKIIKTIKEATKSSGLLINQLEEFIKQFLDRDENWKRFYKQQMEEIEIQPLLESLANNAEIERKAYLEYKQNNFDGVRNLINKIISSADITSEERGWYLEQLAFYLYDLDREDSFLIQQKAHKNNRYLSISPISKKDKVIKLEMKDQASQILEWIQDQDSYNGMIVKLEALFDHLIFGGNANAFERALKEIGKIIGFNSIRPEHEDRNGPDNLWVLPNNKIWVIECKNEVEDSSIGINKDQVGQMANSIAWVKDNFKTFDRVPVYIHPKKNYTVHAHSSVEEFVITQTNLREFKEEIIYFFSKFKSANMGEISLEIVQRRLAESKIIARLIHSFLIKIQKTK